MGDGQIEGQILFHRILLAMSGCPSRETTKEVSDQTEFDNFKHCKSYLLEIGMIYTRETGCCISNKFVMSGLGFLKLVTMIEHKNDANNLS